MVLAIFDQNGSWQDHFCTNNSCAKLIYQPSQQFLLFWPAKHTGISREMMVRYHLFTVGNLYVWNCFCFFYYFLWSWAKLLIFVLCFASCTAQTCQCSSWSLRRPTLMTATAADGWIFISVSHLWWAGWNLPQQSPGGTQGYAGHQSVRGHTPFAHTLTPRTV